MGYRRDRVDNSLSAGPRPSGSGPVAAPVAAPPGNAALGRVLRRFEQPASQGAGPLDPGIGAAIDSARGGGTGLPDPVRTDMEGHFGTDLAAVRVHTGAGADALNRSVQACAFTVGSDIFFSGGSYDPAGAQGRELLAHELTHVVSRMPAWPRTA